MASVLLISIYVVSTLLIVLSGILYLMEPALPQILQDLLLYGKARGKRRQWTVVRLLEIPKQWFVYFYLIGAIANGFMVYTTVFAYVLGQKPHGWLLNTLQFIKSSDEINTGAVSAILLIFLMAVQDVRRLLECIFVSVYSSGTMNVFHFLLGIYLYGAWSLVILCEAPNIATYRVHDLHEELHNPLHLIGILLFIVASFNHHKVHQMFGELRKNSTGKVTTLKHRIPKGGWFELVSCPHYFFEILIYVAFAIVSGLKHKTLWSLVAFVIGNQIIAAFISHRWYQGEFKDYPKKRKAVIPYIL